MNIERVLRSFTSYLISECNICLLYDKKATNQLSPVKEQILVVNFQLETSRRQIGCELFEDSYN